MLQRILSGAIAYRWLIVLVAIGVAVLGIVDFRRLPIDAVPDVTTAQVQVNARVAGLSSAEVEQQVTFPLEWALAGLPGVHQVRSTSRFGFSQVTVVFVDGTDIYRARQLIAERLASAKESLPQGADATMGPIATGLGEIYMYAVEADANARRPDGKPYDLTDLRAIQDWNVRPQLRSVPGVNEVDSVGGYSRIYQVAPDPAKLIGRRLSFGDLFDALATNNANGGGGYIVHHGDQLVVRTLGLVKSVGEIEHVVLGSERGTPIRVGDVATVDVGRDLRIGAATSEGRETVVGTALMLAGENSRVVAKRVAARLREIEASLPPGIHLRPLYDRTALVDETLHTVEKNLAEGALLVIAVLFLMLGNLRGAVIAALAIPLSMLIAVTGMMHLGISGNLMSLGAIDFGLIVDGAVIIVENCVRRFTEEQAKLGRPLEPEERLKIAFEASHEVRRATIFGEAIIAIVYLPILTLTGMEGKMFRPMAATVLLALAGATVLTMTLIPALVALLLRGRVREKEIRVVVRAKTLYARALDAALRRPWVVALAAVISIACAGVLAWRLGGEFVPKLSEGGIALGITRVPSVSVPSSVEMNIQLESTIRKAFPDEVATLFTRVGTGDAATDLMGPGEGDTYILLTPRARWKRASTQDELTKKLADVLANVPGQRVEISQPIELRVNELNAGVRGDVAVKVYGDDLRVMLATAAKIGDILGSTPGGADVKVDQVTDVPILNIEIDRQAIARFGLNVADVQRVVEVAVGGQVAGKVYDGTKRFDLVVRLPEAKRHDPAALARLPVHLPKAGTETDTQPSWLEAKELRYVPLESVARISIGEGPNEIGHEAGRRRVAVQANVRGRDLAGFVAEAQRRVAKEITLPPGTTLEWGGQLENLVAARERLALVVPLAAALVFALLYLSFHSIKHALLVFSGVPLALTGGVVALFVRGIPLSVSAAVGFIALSGVAVLNGLVIVTFVEKERAAGLPLREAIRVGAIERLRPVLMTALVAALGFIPMALATGMGAEVQRPLATVVIGGIISSTTLTMFVLPVLYELAHRRELATEEPR